MKREECAAMLIASYAVTPAKAEAIAACQRYMTSEAWARLIAKLEERRK